MSPQRAKRLMDYISVVVLLWAGWLCGRRFEERELRPQLDHAWKVAMEQSAIAKSWQRQQEQVYPLVQQWRAGYENLQKRCGDAR